MSLILPYLNVVHVYPSLNHAYVSIYVHVSTIHQVHASTGLYLNYVLII